MHSDLNIQNLLTVSSFLQLYLTEPWLQQYFQAQSAVWKQYIVHRQSGNQHKSNMRLAVSIIALPLPIPERQPKQQPPSDTGFTAEVPL